MTRVGLHAAPSRPRTSHRVSGGPPDTTILLSRLGVWNPMKRPSGDQKGNQAPSVSGMRRFQGIEIAQPEMRCAGRIPRRESETPAVGGQRELPGRGSRRNRRSLGCGHGEADGFIRGRAAKRFFRQLLKGQGSVPGRLVTDKLRSYPAAQREVMPSVIHSTQQYENNRAEVSHQPTRQRERQMRRFKSTGQAQRFLTVQGLVQNLFRVGRHLLRARHHRELRGRAFVTWEAVTCAS